MIGLLILTHGRLADEFLATAQAIVGKEPGVAAVSLLAHEGIPQLQEKFRQALGALPQTDGVLVLVDMVGGTPSHAVLPLVQGMSMEVLAGVNLYMLVSALAHRGHLTLSALTQKVLDDGRRSVVNIKEAFLSKLQ